MIPKNITTLVLVTSLFAGFALAESSSTSLPDLSTSVAAAPFPPDQVIFDWQQPSIPELMRVAAARGVAVNQITLSDHDLRVTYRGADGTIKVVSYQVFAYSGAMPNQAPQKKVVYSMPPSPAFSYDEHCPAVWYPSISFRFGAARAHRG